MRAGRPTSLPLPIRRLRSSMNWCFCPTNSTAKINNKAIHRNCSLFNTFPMQFQAQILTNTTLFIQFCYHILFFLFTTAHSTFNLVLNLAESWMLSCNISKSPNQGQVKRVIYLSWMRVALLRKELESIEYSPERRLRFQ